MQVDEPPAEQSQLGSQISLFTEDNDQEDMPANSGLDYLPTVGRLSNCGQNNAPGTVRATDSAFESNNFTYSESGFNPAGSLRQTLQGSNLRNSSIANL